MRVVPLTRTVGRNTGSAVDTVGKAVVLLAALNVEEGSG